MNNPKKSVFVFLSFIFTIVLFAQNTKKVLFIGNSYTYYNDLPQMLANVAATTNDVVIFDSNAPGGASLQGHTTNQTSLNKIMVGNWDFVVLQEQSQRPSLQDQYVQTSVYPFAASLNTTINQYNPCAETLFYMTWGRKNGDPDNCSSWPPVCTYVGMDDLIKQRYNAMTIANNGVTAAVGAVWRSLRNNFPSIELYNSDESHPSEAGTYAAACTFYTTIFRKNPLLITFNGNLSATVAQNIRNAVKMIVFDSFSEWKIGAYDPFANFSFIVANNTVNFTNSSTNATTYSWNFGDNTTATSINPNRTYTNAGSYTVTLTASKCGLVATKTLTVNVGTLGTNTLLEDVVSVHPNPFNDFIRVQTFEKSFANIKITNVLGTSLIPKIKKLDNYIEIDTQNLSQGLYFLTLEIGSSVFTKKILKN